MTALIDSTRGRKPRIAMVTDAVFPFHRGGKELRYHEVGKRLADDADVTVYTMRWWGHRGMWQQERVRHKAIAPMLDLYASDRRSIVQAVVFALCTLRLLVIPFDVIEADHMPYIQLWPLWLVSRIRGKRFVVTWHEVWGAEAWHDYLGPLGRVGWALERMSMRLPDEVVAASRETAERLAPYLPAGTPITVAPNGIDVAEAASVPAHRERVDLVMVARFLPHKRVDVFLEVLASLRRQGVDVTGRIIGDGPTREEMHRLATDLRVIDFVDFRHDVDNQRDLYSLIKAAKVFVFPSEREGFGIAVLEALACGLPVVTTSAPDNLSRHLVERSGSGVVCDPTVEAITPAVRRIVESASREIPTVSLDGDRREQDWLEEYDWSTVSARVREACLR